MFLDSGISYCDSFAKSAVAFFRISRSSSACRSCFRSRRTSASSCSTRTLSLVGEPSADFFADCFWQH